MAKCHSEGIKINFQLDLPPAAAAIVQKSNRDNASMCQMVDSIDSIDHLLIALRRIQNAYLALQIVGGHIGLGVVLAYSVFSRIPRDPTYINFCATWIFSSVAFSLLSTSLLESSNREGLSRPLCIGFILLRPVISPMARLKCHRTYA